MTIFLGVLLGGLVGWLGGNFTTRGLAAFALYMDRKEGYKPEDYEEGDTEDAQRIGAGLMVSEAVVLAAVGGVVAAYAGLTTAFVVALVGLLVIPVAVVLGMFAVYEESGKLATFIYRSPVTAVTSSVAAMVFCYKYARNKIESWIEDSKKPAPVTNLPGTGNGEPQPAICVFPPLPVEGEVVSPVPPAPTTDDGPAIHPIKPTDEGTGASEVVSPLTPAPTEVPTGNGTSVEFDETGLPKSGPHIAICPIPMPVTSTTNAVVPSPTTENDGQTAPTAVQPTTEGDGTVVHPPTGPNVVVCFVPPAEEKPGTGN